MAEGTVTSSPLKERGKQPQQQLQQKQPLQLQEQQLQELQQQLQQQQKRPHSKMKHVNPDATLTADISPTNTNEVATSELPFPLRSGYAKMNEQLYEVTFIAWLFLRLTSSENVSKFHLVWNIDAIGALGDVMVKYKTRLNETVWKTCCIQLKLMETASSIGISSFVIERDFGLKKYLDSYTKIKNILIPEPHVEFFMGCAIKNSTFVLYTNAVPKEDLYKRTNEPAKTNGHREIDTLFKSEEENKNEFVSSFSEQDKYIYNYLVKNSPWEVFWAICASLVAWAPRAWASWAFWIFWTLCGVWPFWILLGNYMLCALCQVCVPWNIWVKWAYWVFGVFCVSWAFWSWSQESPETREALNIQRALEAKDFLKGFRLYSGQPSRNKMKQTIKRELFRLFNRKKERNINKHDIDQLCECYIDVVTKRLEDNTKPMSLAKDSDILKQSINNWETNILSQEETEFLIPSLKFQMVQFDNDHPLLHLSTSWLCTKLSCTKLVRSLPNGTDDYIFVSLKSLLKTTEAMLTAWSSKKNRLVVVVSEPSESHEHLCYILCQHLQERNAESCVKKIVVVSAHDDVFTASLKDTCRGRDLGTKEIEDSFQLGQLEPKCRTLIENRIVSFQGVPTALRNLLGGADSTHGVFNDEFIQKVFGTETISLGPQLDETISYFIPCTLERRDIIRKDVLKENNMDDLFIVHNITKQKMEDLVPGERVGNVANYINDPCRFLVLGSGTTGDMHKVFEKKANVHELKMCSDKTLKWSSTKGSIECVRKMVSENKLTTYDHSTLLDVDGRVVLITAAAGMGKSTLLTHLASETKRVNPTFCVVRVDLKDHKDELSVLCDDAIGFLSEATGISESATDHAILRLMLETGNCVVLLDGFDEIAPDYTDKGLSLLTSLLKTNANKIYVTTRHALEATLQVHLDTLTFSLRKFNEQDLEKFFKLFLTKNKSTPMYKYELHRLIKKLVNLTSHSLSDGDKEFLGTPLIAMLVAEIYENKTTAELPDKLDVNSMFEQVTDKKWNIYLKKQFGNNQKNIGFEQNKLLESVTENQMIVSLHHMLGKERIKHLHNGSWILEKNEKIMAENYELECKVGIFIKVLNGKLVILHRTFAEYYTALWFSQNCDKNQEFLRKHLFSDEFKFIRRHFDLMLTRKSELLRAVVNSDVNTVSSLLERKEENVKTTDLGGRSALHLGAVMTRRYGEPESSLKIVQLLLDHGVDGYGEDRVLGWIVLEYAINTESWSILECILEHLTSGKDSPDGRGNIWHRYHYGLFWDETILHNVCRKHNIETAHALIESLEQNIAIHRTDEQVSLAVTKYINAQNSKRESALHFPWIQGKTHFVDFLTAKGGNVWARNSAGQTPLHINCMSNDCNVDAVRVLIKSLQRNVDKYINTQDAEGNSSLHYASRRNDLELIKFLTSKGGDKWLRNKARDIPLHVLCKSYGSIVDTVKVLIESNNNDVAEYINMKDAEGNTILHYACRSSYSELLALLISNGVDTRACNVDGKTPLHLLCMSYGCNAVTVKSLIETLKRDDVANYINAKDKDGLSSLHYASHRSAEVVKLLVSKGGDVWAVENTRKTPLHRHFIFNESNVDVVSALIETINDNDVADYINMEDINGFSAFNYANQRKNGRVLQLLSSRGGRL